MEKLNLKIAPQDTTNVVSISLPLDEGDNFSALATERSDSDELQSVRSKKKLVAYIEDSRFNTAVFWLIFVYIGVVFIEIVFED